MLYVWFSERQAGIFDELTNLTNLNLSRNSLTTLPSGIFDELSLLKTLNLYRNRIHDVSELEGLTSLTALYIDRNLISNYGPLRRLIAAIRQIHNHPGLTLDITIPANNAPIFTDGTSTTRTVAEHTAANTNIGIPVSATDADNNTLTYTLGGTDASSFSIVSTSGQLQTKAALDYETKTSYSVSVSVSDGNGGSDSITVTITATDVNETPANNAPIFTDGTSTTRTVAEHTAADTNIGTPVSATDADDDTLIYSLGGMDTSAFSIVSTSGQLRTNASLDYETKDSYSISVSVSDSSGGSDSITVTITVTDVDETRIKLPVSDRTKQVQAAIVAAVPGVDAAADVTEAHLAAITSLVVDSKDLTSLKTGDLDGFTNLNSFDVRGGALTSLPSGIFDELKNLRLLYIGDNALTALPSGIFDGLKNLKALGISNNALKSLPSGVFDELTHLKKIGMIGNNLTTVPSGVFDELTHLEEIFLGSNALTSLPSGVFDGLTHLNILSLDNNALTALPSGIFDDLSSLTKLYLAKNQIRDVSELEGLTSLKTVYLSENPISDHGPLRRLIAAIRAAGGSLRIDITIPRAAAAPSVQASRVIPENTALLTNFPNPFNPETWIPYQLAKPTEVTLTIYDIRGVVVHELKLGHQAAGVYQGRSRAIHWDGRNGLGEKVATGIYFYTLKAGDFTATRKLLIRK